MNWIFRRLKQGFFFNIVLIKFGNVFDIDFERKIGVKDDIECFGLNIFYNQ